MSRTVKGTIKKEFGPVLPEGAVYAAFLAGYCFLVVHFLTGWLAELFRRERTAYAFIALALIVAQGFFLERITGLLFHRSKRRREGE